MNQREWPLLTKQRSNWGDNAHKETYIIHYDLSWVCAAVQKWNKTTWGWGWLWPCWISDQPSVTGGRGDPQLGKSHDTLHRVIKSGWKVFDLSYISVKKIFHQNFENSLRGSPQKWALQDNLWQQFLSSANKVSTGPTWQFLSLFIFPSFHLCPALT